MSQKTKSALSRPPRTDSATQEVQTQAFIKGAVNKSRPQDGYPWESPNLRADVVKPFNIRLSEPTKAKLQWLAENSPKSMHQIVLEVVEVEIERRVIALTEN